MFPFFSFGDNFFCQRGHGLMPHPKIRHNPCHISHVQFHRWKVTCGLHNWVKRHLSLNSQCHVKFHLWKLTCENSLATYKCAISYVTFHLGNTWRTHVFSSEKITCAFGTSHKKHVLFLLVSQLMSCRPPNAFQRSVYDSQFLAACCLLVHAWMQARTHTRTHARTHTRTHARTLRRLLSYCFRRDDDRWRDFLLWSGLSDNPYISPNFVTLFFTIIHSITVSGIAFRT